MFRRCVGTKNLNYNSANEWGQQRKERIGSFIKKKIVSNREKGCSPTLKSKSVESHTVERQILLSIIDNNFPNKTWFLKTSYPPVIYSLSRM